MLVRTGALYPCHNESFVCPTNRRVYRNSVNIDKKCDFVTFFSSRLHIHNTIRNTKDYLNSVAILLASHLVSLYCPAWVAKYVITDEYENQSTGEVGNSVYPSLTSSTSLGCGLLSSKFTVGCSACASSKGCPRTKVVFPRPRALQAVKP